MLADIPQMDEPKTQELLGFLAAVDVPGKVLMLTNGKNDNVYLSSRNVSHVSVLRFGDESVYDVLWAHTVVIERSALEDADGKSSKSKAKAKAAEPEPEIEEPEVADEADADEEEEESDA